MIFSVLADLVLTLHLAFVLFVVFGGFFVLRRPRLAWLHIPCATWGVMVVVAGWICPLTYLEDALRRLGGSAGYTGGFLSHYVSLLLYPPGLTRPVQIGLGLAALAFNLGVYAMVWRRTHAPEREAQ